jgi:hypothetical protein
VGGVDGGSVMRRRVIASALLALPLVLALTSTLADASVRRERIHVSPSSGSPSTVFVLLFRAPERTGRNGSSQRHDLITASVPRSASGCVTSIDVRAPDVAADARVRISLDPRKLGGSWCPGVYHGRIEELQTAVCLHGKLCPTYVVTRGAIGRFTFRVKRGALPPTGRSSGAPPPGTSPPPPGTSPPPSGTPPPAGSDTTPPTFAGLQSAYACTPGPVRPGETTAYTLTWQAATDDVTPSSQILYDVFLAYTSGSEDFSHPTWTTAPSVTTYTTPGLPSEGNGYLVAGGGTYYLVVRARDQAGNENQNKVERRGYQVCE